MNDLKTSILTFGKWSKERKTMWELRCWSGIYEGILSFLLKCSTCNSQEGYLYAWFWSLNTRNVEAYQASLTMLAEIANVKAMTAVVSWTRRQRRKWSSLKHRKNRQKMKNMRPRVGARQKSPRSIINEVFHCLIKWIESTFCMQRMTYVLIVVCRLAIRRTEAIMLFTSFVVFIHRNRSGEGPRCIHLSPRTFVCSLASFAIWNRVYNVDNTICNG